MTSHEGIQVWFGQGKAKFQASDQGFIALPSTTSVALGDLDGDGNLDAFIARSGPNEIWLNRGKGQLALSQVLDENFETFAAALGDLDGDGGLDAYLGNTKNNPNCERMVSSYSYPRGLMNQ